MNDTVEQSEQATIHYNREFEFEFRGDGFEYFKIWIVNVLLTILTLGIYSAWAKVRSGRYFYSNLYLGGNNFRYLAEPLTILKGRIIAVLALIGFAVISNLNEMAGIVLSFVLIFAMPYLVNQSLSFNNRMSAYNNIQFRFKGNYGEAFMVLFVWPILGILSFGILYPLAILRANQYVVRNSSYGTTSFEFSASYSDYGKIFLIALLSFTLFVGPFFVAQYFFPEFKTLLTLPIAVAYFCVFVYFSVAVQNLFYKCLSLRGGEFGAEITMGGFIKVVLINMALIILTLGLYLPAAKVRMTRYLASCVFMNSDDSLENFSAAESENISALGEEFGQVFDFGI